MRFAAALFVGAVSAQNFQTLTFTHYTDRECKQNGNATVEPLNKCIVEIREGRARMLRCNRDGTGAEDQEYRDSDCKTEAGPARRIEVNTCVQLGGARGSHQAKCTGALGDEVEVEDQSNDFEAWVSRHGKVYATAAEHEKRAEIFKANLLKAQLGNIESVQNGGDAVFGVTQFSDLTEEEFRNTYLMPNYQPTDEERFVETAYNAPTDIDWRSRGVITNVKDQGQCGSCWAFSATEAIESYSVISGKYRLQALSPQQINSCDRRDGGCNGGNTETAYQYVVQAGGIETEASYPYTSGRGQTGPCLADASKFVVKIAGYRSVAQGESNLEAALNNGPVSVCLAADAFQTYRGGILASCPGRIDHCVQAVGYTADTWLVRNSWGANWGEAGYIRIKRGSNLCMISNDVTYPTF